MGAPEIKAFEPAAATMLMASSERGIEGSLLQLGATMSIAISLKRIADMLDAVTTDSRFGIGVRIITNGDDQ